jgi:hypothetical protein
MSNVPLPRVKYLILSSETLVLSLKPVERLIFGFVLSLEKNNKQCFASNGYFAQLLNVSSATVQRAIAHLVQRGLLRHCLIHHSGTQRLLSVNTVQLEAEVLQRLQRQTVADAPIVPVPPLAPVMTLPEQLALEEAAKDDAQRLAVQQTLDDVLGTLEKHRLTPLTTAAAVVEQIAMRQMAEEIIHEHRQDVLTLHNAAVLQEAEMPIASPIHDGAQETEQCHASPMFEDCPPEASTITVDKSPSPLEASLHNDEALAHSEEALPHFDKAPPQNDVARDKQFLRENSYKKFIDRYEQRAEQRIYKTYQRNNKTSEIPQGIQQPTSSFAKGTYRTTSHHHEAKESSKGRVFTNKETRQYQDTKNGCGRAFNDVPTGALFEWEGSANIYGTFKKLDNNHALRLDINKVITIPDTNARAVLRQ